VLEKLNNFNLIVYDWSIYEELLFHDALLKFGVGSWKEISKFIMTKNPIKCEAHFKV
jgi:hypothetical protein